MFNKNKSRRVNKRSVGLQIDETSAERLLSNIQAHIGWNGIGESATHIIKCPLIVWNGKSAQCTHTHCTRTLGFVSAGSKQQIKNGITKKGTQLECKKIERKDTSNECRMHKEIGKRRNDYEPSCVTFRSKWRVPTDRSATNNTWQKKYDMPDLSGTYNDYALAMASSWTGQ